MPTATASPQLGLFRNLPLAPCDVCGRLDTLARLDGQRMCRICVRIAQDQLPLELKDPRRVR